MIKQIILPYFNCLDFYFVIVISKCRFKKCGVELIQLDLLYFRSHFIFSIFILVNANGNTNFNLNLNFLKQLKMMFFHTLILTVIYNEAGFGQFSPLTVSKPLNGLENKCDCKVFT